MKIYYSKEDYLTFILSLIELAIKNKYKTDEKKLRDFYQIVDFCKSSYKFIYDVLNLKFIIENYDCSFYYTMSM